VRDKSARALSDEVGRLEVFSGLSGRAVDALVDAGRLVHLPSNWALIAENTPADSVYVLLAGSTEVRHGKDVLATLGAGSLVGEAAIVASRRRNATVVSVSEVRALRVGYDELNAVFAQHPSVQQRVTAEWERRSATAP
jgi:CRP-like cAMP-binding protein